MSRTHDVVGELRKNRFAFILGKWTHFVERKEVNQEMMDAAAAAENKIIFHVFVWALET